MRSGNAVLGVGLILIGCLFLVQNIFDIEILSMNRLWPLLVLGLGLIFEAGYLAGRKNPGLLVPGGILTTIGLLFIFETSTGWRYSGYTWPVYILAPAVGLFQLYLATGRQKGLLIPVFILAAVAFISFADTVASNLFSWLNGNTIVALVIIAVGLLVLFRDRKKE